MVRPRSIASRECEPKATSSPRFAFNTDLSLVCFDGESAKREAKAGRMSLLGAALGLSKFLKDVLLLIRRNPLPVVADRDGDIGSVAPNIYQDGSI